MWFKNLVYELECRFEFIRFLITSLCDIEMGIKFLFLDKEIKHICYNPNKKIKKQDETIEEFNNRKTPAQLNIPENTFYCSGCPYASSSEIADFFYGYQSSGYCYYLSKGDFSFINPTEILWDGCKECGINEDIDDYIDN